MQTTACPTCQYQLNPEWYFCPNCGKQLKEKVPVITIGKQITIYLVSFFLAPLGLGWGFKYIRSKDPSVRMVGVAAIVLTAVSIAAIIVTFKSFSDQYARILDSMTNGTLR